MVRYSIICLIAYSLLTWEVVAERVVASQKGRNVSEERWEDQGGGQVTVGCIQYPVDDVHYTIAGHLVQVRGHAAPRHPPLLEVRRPQRRTG